jgi:hypothetical protein
MKKPGLHNGEEELAGVVLELENEIHPGLAQRVDVVQDQGRDDPQPVRLVGRYASLKKTGVAKTKIDKKFCGKQESDRNVFAQIFDKNVFRNTFPVANK